MTAPSRRAPGATLGALAESTRALLGVLAIGVALRLWAVRHARFDADEARSWAAALGIARGESFPALGVPISDGDATTPGPLFYYLMALPQLLSSDPRASALFTAALNLIGVWLVFQALRRWAEPGIAFSALVVATASPWFVAHGDRIWSANLLIPLGGAATCALAAVVHEPRSRAVGPLAWILVSGFQVHATCFHLWIVTLVACFVFRVRLNPRWLAGGLVLGLLTYVPYAAHEWASGFANTRLLAAGGGGRPRRVTEALDLLLYPLDFAATDVSFLIARGFFSGGFEHVGFWLRGGIERTAAYYAETGASPLLTAVQLLGWSQVAAGVAVSARRLTRATERSFWDVAFFGGALSLLLLYLAAGRGGFAHYALILAPLSLWPLALALRMVLQRRWWWVGVFYLAALPLNGLLLLRPYYRLDTRQSAVQQSQVIAFILERTGGRRPFELNLAWEEGRAASYGLLARHHHRVPWRAAPEAPDVFTVVPTELLASTQPRGRVAAAARLGALTVIHSRR